MKRNLLLGSILLAVLFAIGYLVRPPQNQSQIASERVFRVDSAMPHRKGRRLLPEVVTVETDTEAPLFVDWNRCLDDRMADTCISAITPLVHSVHVVGDLSYVDLIERMDGNMLMIKDALARIECEPSPTGLNESFAGALDCGAEAFAELGELLRGCKEAGVVHGFVDRLERSNVTDLQQLAEAEQRDRYEKLRYSWLTAKCPPVIEKFKAMPTLVPNEEALKSYGNREQKAARAYTERAVLLGDYRVADQYAESASEMSRYRHMFRHEQGYWRDLTGVQPARLGDEAVVLSLKSYDAFISQVIGRLVARNPELGYQQLADHEYFRFPDFQHHRPDQFGDLIADMNSDPEIIAGNAPKYFEAEEDWASRTFSLVKFQLAANRLAGRSEDLHYTKAGAGKLGEIKPMIDRYLDANDLEYASQEAWKIVRQVSETKEKGMPLSAEGLLRSGL